MYITMETKEYVYLWVLDFNDGQVYKYKWKLKNTYTYGY
jgi:hypothetical protein